MGTRLVLEDRLEEHLAGIFPEQEEARPEEGAKNAPEIIGVIGPAGREGEALPEANTRRHRWIEKAGRQQREVVRWGYRRIADLRVSATDPDASPMQHKKGASRLGYLTHYAVDGGKARVILDVLVTPAEVTENLPMLELLFKSRFRWRLRPRSVTGDAAYGTVENVAAVEKAGIRAYVVLPKHDERGPCSARTSSSTMPRRIITSVPKARPYAGRDSTTRRDPSGTPPNPPPATRVRSRLAARRARRRDAGSGEASMRSISKGCEATAKPKPTARH